MPALGAALFVAVALAYGMGSLSAAMPRWLVLYIWAAVTCVVLGNRMRGDHIDTLAFALLSWMALSVLWSADRLQGIFELTNAASICAVFMWVRRYPDWIPEAALVALTGTLILQYLHPYDWGGHGNMNFQTEAILMLLALGSQSQRWWPVFFVLLCCSAAYLIMSNPSKIEWFVLLMIGIFHGQKLYNLYRCAA